MLVARARRCWIPITVAAPKFRTRPEGRLVYCFTMAAMVETGAVPRRRSARLAKSGVGADATPAMPSQPVRGSSKKAVSTPPPRPEQEKATLTRKRKRSAGDTPGAGGGGDTKADPGLSPGPAGDEREPGPCQYWLFKSEPETRMTNGVDVKFSIDDLRDCTEPEPWGGVRNYLARNNMMAMKEGDLGFFYHSNTKVPGIVGVCEVVETAGVDGSLLLSVIDILPPRRQRCMNTELFD